MPSARSSNAAFAASALGKGFDYERAATLLGTAVALDEQHDLPDRVGSCWSGPTRCSCADGWRTPGGRTGAPSTRPRADDWAARARPALGLGGVWVNEHRGEVDRRRVLDLQRSALADLPAGADVLRMRLEVRLAAEAVYDGEPVEPVLAALDQAVPSATTTFWPRRSRSPTTHCSLPNTSTAEWPSPTS